MPDYLGGFTFGLDMDAIPLILYDDGSTIRIGIGAKDKIGDSDESKKEKCKSLKEAVEQYLTESTDDAQSEIANYKKMNNFYKALGSKGISDAPHAAKYGFNISVYGYLEIKYNESGYQSAYGRAVIIMSGQVKNEWQIIVGVVPIVLKASMGASVNTDVQVGYPRSMV